MKTTTRSRALIAAAIALAFSAILFQDIIIMIAFFILLAILFSEFLWLAVVVASPGHWFQVQVQEKARTEGLEDSKESTEYSKRRKKQGKRQNILYPGEQSEEVVFLLTKRGTGSISLASEIPFLSFSPGDLGREDHFKQIRADFRTPYSGEYAVRELELSVTGPLKLFAGRCAIPLSINYTVFPKVVQVAITSSKLLGRASGIGETPINLPGVGTEYYDMREYQLGDDFRQINWKASARRGGLIVNERMKEVGGSCYIILESGGAVEYFEKDRLATAFLQIANSLAMLRMKFGVIIHDGEKISAIKRIDIPENSLGFALGAALEFAEIRSKKQKSSEADPAWAEEVLTGVASYVLKSNQNLMKNVGLELLSEIESTGRLNLRRTVRGDDPFRGLLGVIGENPSEPPDVIYISGLRGPVSPLIELGSEIKRVHGARFTLVNPSMPWVTSPSEEDAFEAYNQMMRKLRAFEVSHIEYILGEPAAIASRLFSI